MSEKWLDKLSVHHIWSGPIRFPQYLWNQHGVSFQPVLSQSSAPKASRLVPWAGREVKLQALLVALLLCFFLNAVCRFCFSSIAPWWRHAAADLLRAIFRADTDTQVCGQSRKQQMLQPRGSESGADGTDPPSATSPLAVSWLEASWVGRRPRPCIKMGSTCNSSSRPCIPP